MNIGAALHGRERQELIDKVDRIDFMLGAASGMMHLEIETIHG
jgi:hypothetical protein